MNPSTSLCRDFDLKEHRHRGAIGEHLGALWVVQDTDRDLDVVRLIRIGKGIDETT